MENQLEQFKNLLKLDKNALDVAIEEQADIYYRISEAYAQAVSEQDALSERVKEVQAKLDLEIREAFLEEGKKVTESQISSSVQNDSSYKDIKSKHLASREKVANLAALQEAFRQRSHMLKELVNLYVAGYYSDQINSQAKKEHKDVKYEGGRKRLSNSRKEKIKHKPNSA